VKIPSQVLTLLFGIVLTLISLWYGYNHHLLPIAASQEAVLIDDLFNFMMVISVGIFILVQSSLLWVAFRYRRNPDDETDAKYVHGNIPLEIVWTAIPAVIMLALSLYSFDVYEQIGGLNPMDHSAHMANTEASQPQAVMMSSPGSSSSDHPMMVMDSETTTAPSSPLARTSDPFVVNVSGLQFAWLFNYAGTELSTGELHLPVNREIILNISAMDVLHAFWVPEFRIKQDAVPGRTIAIRITPTKVGTYPLICAELCGAYHGVMRSQVIVESEADVNTWMAAQAVAMKEVDQAVEDSTAIAALHPELLSDAAYLQPYAKTLGVTVEHIRSIQAAQQQS
jgi:cytochrome c oxidase subunit II